MKSLVLILILSVMFQAKAKKNPDYIYKAAAQVRVFLLRHTYLFSLFGVCYRLSLYQLQCYILTVSAQQFWSVAADII